MTSSNLAGREPQSLPGVPPLAQGGNVFAVSVAWSLAEAEQRQASGRRAPNRSFVEYRALLAQNRGAAGARLRSAVLARSFLGKSFLSKPFQLSFNCICRVSDVPHRFRKAFLRYIEFVGPVLNFMGLKQVDSASILRTPIGEIIRHSFSPLEATRWRV